MIIKYYSKTGEIIHTLPETFYMPKDPAIGRVQVYENGKPKYAPGDIKTIIIDGITARDFEDPRHPANIHHHVIVFDNTGKPHHFKRMRPTHDEKRDPEIKPLREFKENKA